jgi:hypothetical protein
MGSNLSLDIHGLVLIVFVLVEALRWTDPPPKESYRLCVGFETEEAAKTH